MARSRGLVAGLLTAELLCGWTLAAQTTGKTVRHHREAVVDQTSQELARAENAIEKKDYASAEPLLRKIVDSDPSDYQAWFDLGFVYNAQGKLEDSINAYRRSVTAKPDIFESNLNLGLMLAKARQADAERYLRAATRLTPTDHAAEGRERAWLSLARVLENRKPQEALAAYREAAALQPNDTEPHISAGLLLERENDLNSAEKEYQQVLGLDPRSVEALSALANIYMRGKRLPEAENALRRVVVLRPQDGGIHVQLGRILAASEKHDDAIAELQAGLKLAPGDTAAERDLADVYAAAGNYNQAEALYRPLLAATPNDAELHQGLGQALMKQRKFPEAQQEFLQAVKLKPNDPAVYGDLAAVANENKDYSLVIKALDARAKLAPETPPISHFFRATAYDHLRDYKQAAANYRLFLQAADGKFPDQEWQARHRLIAIEPKK